MRRAQIGVIASSMMITALTGCLIDRPYDREPGVSDGLQRPSMNGNYRPVRGAVDGRLTGDVGPVRSLDADANLLSAYDDGYYMSVETVVELQDRAVMTLLSVSNGAEIFQPGLDATFSLDNYDSDGVQVTMLGCVGQDVGIYDEYDMPADEVKVVVDEGPNADEMDVALEARWYDRDNETGVRQETFRNAHTSFTLLR
jgi:hypothetical protein